MSRLRLSVLLLVLALGGCFTSRPSAEGYRQELRRDMDRGAVRLLAGDPKDVHPIPGQGAAVELPVEQWRYEWSHKPGKTMTLVLTLGLGLIWMDKEPYGFDVGFDRDGRVRVISDVGPRPR